MVRRPTLSTNEWAVLGVLVDGPRHGYDIAAALQPGEPIGDAWRLSRQLVYRALDRLHDLGLAEPRRTERGEAGRPRTVYAATRRGRAAVRSWVVAPVPHLRDVRGELLLKLVLIDRLGLDRQVLVTAQRHAFAELFEALLAPPDDGDVVARWRHHSAAAVDDFLRSLDESVTPPA